MDLDITAARSFLAGHGRLLDRRRFDVLTGGEGGPEALAAALEAYSNPDGGFGWGIEPDFRSPEQIAADLRSKRSLTAEEAKRYGLVDELAERRHLQPVD